MMTDDTTDDFDVEWAYTATMHSVHLINRIYDSGEAISEEDMEAIQRNKAHIQIMLGQDYWTEAHDLQPFQAAFDRTS